MLPPVAYASRSFGRWSGSQCSVLLWAWSWVPLRFARRQPPHHLSPAQARLLAGQSEARLWRPHVTNSNALFLHESQSILSKIIARQRGRPFKEPSPFDDSRTVAPGLEGIMSISEPLTHDHWHGGARCRWELAILTFTHVCFATEKQTNSGHFAESVMCQQRKLASSRALRSH